MFNMFNSISWQFLVGTIIILLAMRLKASSTVIGLINALVYVSFFFLPLGKALTRKFSIIKIYGTAWIGRALGMVPLLLIPFVAAAGRADLGIWIILLGVLFFHTGRGIGMIANNPVLNELASGPDRGSYVTQIQIINSGVALVCSLAIAIVLGRNPSLTVYAILLGIGIAGGVLSGALVLKIPEPQDETGGHSISFFGIFREAFSRQPVRHFIIILLQVALVSGVARAFIMVYSREIFHQSDGMVSLFSVFGGLGNLVIGLSIKFLVDRIGVKPIYIICMALGLVSMAPILFFPAGMAGNQVMAAIYLSFLFFIMNFGFLGAEGIAQTYFLALIPPELMLDMSILYFFVFGVAGAGGSFMAGLFLDFISVAGVSQFMSFKILYGVLIAMAVCILIMMRRLVPLGSLPLRGAVGVLFSFRDLKAITLLDRLRKSTEAGEEEALLGALHDTPSQLATKGLLDRATSPRLAIRQESIRALETLETLSGDAEKALMDDMINHPFTTAYISARILGNHGCSAAIPLLRELSVSGDYMLAGEAIIALARLNDEAFRPQIEEIIIKTRNPRLKIMGVEAFGIYGSPASLTVLLDILRFADPPPYMRDEVVLSMSSIIGVEKKFYPLLVRFLENESDLATLIMDEAESAAEFYRTNRKGRKTERGQTGREKLNQTAAEFLPSVVAYNQEKNGAALSRWIMDLPIELSNTLVQVVLSEALLDDELDSFDRLRLLIVHWAARQLRKFP
ncbi:MFS transporter [Spirochaetia bacterium]|nr:MFS transporter [Spirochaetia bacterium]